MPFGTFGIGLNMKKLFLPCFLIAINSCESFVQTWWMDFPILHLKATLRCQSILFSNCNRTPCNLAHFTNNCKIGLNWWKTEWKYIFLKNQNQNKKNKEQISKLLVLHNAFSIVSCLGAEEDLVCISNLGRKGTMTNKQTNKGEMTQTALDRKGKITNKQTRGIPSPLSPLSYHP